MNSKISFSVSSEKPLSPDQWRMLSHAVNRKVSIDLGPNQVRVYTSDDKDAQALVDAGLFKYVSEWIDPHEEEFEEFKDDLHNADWTHKVYQATENAVALCKFIQFIVG